VWVPAGAAWLGSLRHLSLLAVLSWTAHAHWSLAVLLGAPVWLAWTLPIAVDAYVLSALRAWETSPDRRHRDLAWALGLDGVAVAGAHAASQVAVPAPWRAGVAALLGVVLVLVLWRVHALDVEVRRAKPKAQRPRAQDRMIESVSHEAPDVPSTARTAVQRAAGDELGTWVAAQRAAGTPRAKVIAQGVQRWGVSPRTVERRWAAAA
jgi:hypothetical protein